MPGFSTKLIHADDSKSRVPDIGEYYVHAVPRTLHLLKGTYDTNLQ